MTAPYAWRDRLPLLETPRLRLRATTPEDAPALLRIFGDPEVMRYWSAPPMADLAAAGALLARIERDFRERTHFTWGVAPREGGELIGTCTLFQLELAHRRAEVGFALGRAQWGRGLAGETLARVLRFAFEILDLHRIEADADPDNARSLRLLEKQGFRREGLMRERWHHLGEVRDGVCLGLLRPEWVGETG